jgi:hypothetical protein
MLALVNRTSGAALMHAVGAVIWLAVAVLMAMVAANSPHMQLALAGGCGDAQSLLGLIQAAHCPACYGAATGLGLALLEVTLSFRRARRQTA